jgi:hypothetical protein
MMRPEDNARSNLLTDQDKRFRRYREYVPLGMSPLGLTLTLIAFGYFGPAPLGSPVGSRGPHLRERFLSRGSFRSAVVTAAVANVEFLRPNSLVGLSPARCEHPLHRLHGDVGLGRRKRIPVPSGLGNDVT